MQWGAALLRVAATAVSVVGADREETPEADAAAEKEEQEPQHGFQRVPRDDPAWKEMATLMRNRSRKYHEKYRNQEMVIKNLWRIPAEEGRDETEEELADTFGPSMQLFHGTEASSAEGIATEGFRIPTRPGMFGRGVYFARCPLKSIQYSKKPGAWFRLKKQAHDAMSNPSGVTGQHRVMLVCDVYLGRQRTERLKLNLKTYKEVESPQDLKPTCFDLFCCPQVCCDYCCKGGWDSVYAPGGSRCNNLVRVSEFVVYDKRQAIPLFMVEFDLHNVRPGRRNKSQHSLVGEPVAVATHEMGDQSRKNIREGSDIRAS